MTAAPTPAPPMDAPRPHRERIARAAALLAVWTLGALPAAFGVMRCPSATLLHRACPGCGTTRAMHLLLHGDIAASLAMHPLAIPSTLATLFIALATVWATYRRGSTTELLADRVGWTALAVFLVVNVAMLVVWIARACGALGGLPPV